MGVLPCDRLDCENVMCDRLSRKYGYICDECFDELTAYQPESIEALMNTAKNNMPEASKNYDEIFPFRTNR